MNNRDEFDDPKGTDLLGSIGPKAAFFIVLIALSFMIGVVWKLYVGGGSSDVKNIPIIRADSEPYKVDPDEPGGMQMPHKDSTIFSSLNSDPDEDRGIENLLAETDEEKPMPRSQLFAGLNTEPNADLQDEETQETPLDKPLTEVAQQVAETKSEKVDLLEDSADNEIEIPKKVEPILPSSDEEAAKQKLIEEAKIEAEKAQALIKEKEAEIAKKAKAEQEKIAKEKAAAEKAAAEKAAAEKAKKAAQEKAAQEKAAAEKAAKEKEAAVAVAPAPEVVVGTGDYYVQLASVQDRARTDAEWSKLQSKYGTTLSGYKYRVETANLAKGTYYRIQAGPVSKAQATTTCNAIKRKDPNGCLVKKK